MNPTLIGLPLAARRCNAESRMNMVLSLPSRKWSFIA
jgi:hypothetical protein